MSIRFQLFIGLLLLVSCKKDDNDINKFKTIFILNEGKGNSNIASYQIDGGLFVADVYQTVNKTELSSGVSDIKKYREKLYILFGATGLIQITNTEGFSIGQIVCEGQQLNQITFWGHYLYVSTPSGIIYKYNVNTLLLEDQLTVIVGTGCLSAVNNKLYVAADEASQAISIIDIESFREIKKITLDDSPQQITPSPSGDIYLSSPTQLQRLSTESDEITFSLDIPVQHLAIAAQLVYITDYNPNTRQNKIQVLDASVDTLVNSFAVNIDPIQQINGIVIDPETSDVYILDNVSNALGKVHCFNSVGELKFLINDVGSSPKQIIFQQLPLSK